MSWSGCLAPAVIVAAVTLVVQGIIGMWSASIQARASKVAYVVSMLALLDGLPMSAGERAAKKAVTARTILGKSIPAELKEPLERGLG